MNEERRKKQLAKLLSEHPLPWKLGECHETMAQVWDANSKRVVTVNSSIYFESDPALVVKLLIGALNREHAMLVAQKISSGEN